MGRQQQKPAVTPGRWMLLWPLGWMTLIQAVASLPAAATDSSGSTAGPWLALAHNALHIPAFGVLAILWRWALRAWLRNRSGQIGLAFALSVGFGLVNEASQLAVPGRYTSWGDVISNTIGAVLALWLYERLRR